MPSGDDRPPADRLRAGPHVFVDDLDAPVLAEGDEHHLRRVLRRRDGDPLTASDGRGRWRPLRLGATLEPDGPIVDRPVIGPPLTVGVALPKGDRPEWLVQKLTELGIDRIVVLAAERSVVRWDGERAARHLDRLRRVGREAAMQSRRCTLPELTGPVAPSALAGDGVGVAEPGGAPLDAATTGMLIGPEGGWTAEERTGMGPAVGLGGSILRTETAAVAAAVLLVDRHRGPGGW